MKPKCDMEVKKSNSEVMPGLHFSLQADVCLMHRLSYGQGHEKWGRLHFFWTRPQLTLINHPVDNFGTVVGENPDCLLLTGTVVGENPDHVCWAKMFTMQCPSVALHASSRTFDVLLVTVTQIVSLSGSRLGFRWASPFCPLRAQRFWMGSSGLPWDLKTLT